MSVLEVRQVLRRLHCPIAKGLEADALVSEARLGCRQALKGVLSQGEDISGFGEWLTPAVDGGLLRHQEHATDRENDEEEAPDEHR